MIPYTSDGAEPPQCSCGLVHASIALRPLTMRKGTGVDSEPGWPSWIVHDADARGAVDRNGDFCECWACRVGTIFCVNGVRDEDAFADRVFMRTFCDYVTKERRWVARREPSDIDEHGYLYDAPIRPINGGLLGFPYEKVPRTHIRAVARWAANARNGIDRGFAQRHAREAQLVVRAARVRKPIGWGYPMEVIRSQNVVSGAVAPIQSA